MSVLCFVMVVGCTKPTYYRPASHGFGYAEQNIGHDRFRVVFAGNHKTRRETAHQYVLFRAAQLADHGGFSYVAINDQSQRIERYGDLRSRPTQRLDLGLEDGGSPADLGGRDDDGRIRSAVERYQAILDVTFYHDKESVPSTIREVYATDEVLKEVGKAIEFEAGPAGGDYITSWADE
ncbi:MAG: hypothetical protein OEU92_12150 [Alphaproteobacteria bacterium]|nr:hypothetical protein [Alphaproteobacteria bacterium]